MHLEALGPLSADLVLVAVADPAVTTVAEQLAPYFDAKSNAAVALHVAGRLGPAALAPLAPALAVGCLHPLRAFPRPELDLGAAGSTLLAVDGDPAALALAARIGAALGLPVARVTAEHRTLYHLAASLAAGGVTSLVATAMAIATQLGLDPAVAAGYRELALGALSNLPDDDAGAAAAVTGPAARGDHAVLVALAQLAQVAPDLAPTVALAALATTRVRSRAGLATESENTLSRKLCETLADVQFLDPRQAR
jgi:predicted short-subunit dehydrogenase-like oxidoreductase (DUF2520 family)